MQLMQLKKYIFLNWKSKCGHTYRKRVPAIKENCFYKAKKLLETCGSLQAAELNQWMDRPASPSRDLRPFRSPSPGCSRSYWPAAVGHLRPPSIACDDSLSSEVDTVSRCNVGFATGCSMSPISRKWDELLPSQVLFKYCIYRHCHRDSESPSNRKAGCIEIVSTLCWWFTFKRHCFYFMWLQSSRSQYKLMRPKLHSFWTMEELVRLSRLATSS